MIFPPAHCTILLYVHGKLSVNDSQLLEKLATVHSFQVDQGKPLGTILEVGETIQSLQQLGLLCLGAAHEVRLHHQQVFTQRLYI